MKFKNGDIIIPKGRAFLEQVLVADGYDEHGCLWAHPFVGVGCQYQFNLGAERNFRLFTKPKRQSIKN